MGVLPHIKRLDDALGHFLVRITCRCGAQRIAEPEALARLCGASATLEAVGGSMRRSKCGAKGAEVVAISIPRLRSEACGTEEASSGARAVYRSPERLTRTNVRGWIMARDTVTPPVYPRV